MRCLVNYWRGFCFVCRVQSASGCPDKWSLRKTKINESILTRFIELTFLIFSTFAIVVFLTQKVRTLLVITFVLLLGSWLQHEWQALEKAQNIQSKIASQNWESITESMHENGFAIIPNLLNNEQCEDLKFDYDNPNLYRKTVLMERYRFGLGEYKYFNYPSYNIFLISFPYLINNFFLYLHENIKCTINKCLLWF